MEHLRFERRGGGDQHWPGVRRGRRRRGRAIRRVANGRPALRRRQRHRYLAIVRACGRLNRRRSERAEVHGVGTGARNACGPVRLQANRLQLRRRGDGDRARIKGRRLGGLAAVDGVAERGARRG